MSSLSSSQFPSNDAATATVLCCAVLGLCYVEGRRLLRTFDASKLRCYFDASKLRCYFDMKKYTQKRDKQKRDKQKEANRRETNRNEKDRMLSSVCFVGDKLVGFSSLLSSKQNKY